MAKLVHISKGYSEACDHIIERRDKDIYLQTRWSELNDLLMGGIAPNTILTIGGVSGSGKSSLCSMIETDVCSGQLNPDKNVIIINFSLEMLPRNQVTRKIAYLTHSSTRQLWSVGKKKIDKKLLDKCLELKDLFSDMPVFYAEGTIDVQVVEEIVREMQRANEDKWVLVILDHTMLVEGMGDERRTIVALQKVFNDIKRAGKTSVIQIS